MYKRQVDSNGIPKKGLLLAAVKMTALMILITLMNSTGGKASDLFGELTGIAVPVSYTHLDMYKRQGQYRLRVRNYFRQR